MWVKKPIEVLAKQINVPFTVTTGSGRTIYGKPGDWLMDYGESGLDIVMRETFEETYNIVAGKGMKALHRS